jgi:MFS family permease
MTRIFLSVALLSTAALMLESTYTRLLAVAQFYHFAFLVVSLALLGFGASGSLLSIFPGWYLDIDDPTRREKLPRLLSLSGLGFTVSIGLSYIVINWLPFDSYSIAWDSTQILYFGLYYLGLTIPFLFAGLGIGAALSGSPGKSSKVYATNLFGSAAGILLGLIIMQIAGVPGAMLACGIIGLAAMLISGWNISNLGRFLVWGIGVFGIVSLVILFLANSRHDSEIGVTISPYKGLSYALRIPGAEKLYGRWNAVSRIDVVSGASTRVMPGLSYTFTGNPPNQLGMALDADSLQPITLIDPEDFSAANYLPESIAFRLKPESNVMVLESGGGLGGMQALASGANQVTAVVNNKLLVDAISETASEQDVYSLPKVQTHIESSRVALRSSNEKFDVVYLPLSDPYRPVASGAYSLSENYSLTVESISDMLTKLSPDGLLVVTRWIQTPPSESLRLFATLIEGLERLGILASESKIVAYRGIQTMTFLVKLEGWEDEQLTQIRNFLDERRFDLVWSPDINPAEVNRHNKLAEPEYFHQFRELISAESRQDFYSDYSSSIRPARDDHPFFFHFFKWQQTPEILATFGRVWQPFGGSGYFVLIALLILVVLLSSLLIILPLIIHSRRTKSIPKIDDVDYRKGNKVSPWRVFTYFGSIGIAFLFLEIPIIQKSILSMEHPIYAFTLVVLTILMFSGLGSYLAPRFWNFRRLILITLFGLAIIIPLGLGLIQEQTLGWPLIPRILVIAISLAPLGLLMGFPFPFGLTWLEKAGSRLVPWAWAVNGCASVIAAVLAAILALGSSFSVVLIIGAIFYGIAGMVMKA